MMPEPKQEIKKATPNEVLNGESPWVLTATLNPVAGLDRFQPAGFPEVGHVIYRAPRGDGTVEQVCIVDSAASMANHLESVCMRGSHDYDLVDELQGVPYLRCVTDPEPASRNSQRKEVVVTSLTEGHRIASTYFLDGRRLTGNELAEKPFEAELADEFGIALKGGKRAHPPAEKWWQVFETIFKYDPNALVHGVLFPKWQIKIPRALTAHLEAFGAGRVDRSGVKFDRLGRTTSGQPIFAIDDATAQEIRATFILDVALVRSFGRKNNKETLGLTDEQKEFVVALTLWKIRKLLDAPFRFRSGCHLQKVSLTQGGSEIEIDVNIEKAIKAADFKNGVTDIFWPRTDLYREGVEDEGSAAESGQDGGGEEDQDE